MSFTNLTPTQGHYGEILKGLEFYKEELERLRERLQEVASKNSGLEARQGMEQYEAQFTLQRTQIDELRHKVQLLHQKMAADAMEHAGKVEQELVTTDKDLLNEYHLQESIVQDLRTEFNRYLSKWM